MDVDKRVSRWKLNLTMSPKKNIRWKHEWHLYSAVAITASITFIVVQISTGTPQVVGAAFSALVGTFLFTSESWKSVSPTVHQWGIFFAIALAMVGGIAIYWQDHRKTN